MLMLLKINITMSMKPSGPLTQGFLFHTLIGESNCTKAVLLCSVVFVNPKSGIYHLLINQ